MYNDLVKVIGEIGVKTFFDSMKSAKGEDTGTFEIIITTENVDRMGEVIKADGWETENYMKNPIVLWGHNYSLLPVGITDSLEKTVNGQLIARGRFAPADANPMGQQLRRLYDLGLQRASSVGFIPKEYEGNLITKAELLEWSFVTVPANPHALTLLADTDISINEMIQKGFIGAKEADVVIDEPEPVVDEDPAPVADPVDPPADEETKPDEVVPPKDDEEKPADEITDSEEKEFVVQKEMTFAVSNLKDAVSVLEGLIQKGLEHRGNQSPIDDSSLSDEEKKHYADYVKSRKVLQLAATVIGDVLAQARHQRIIK